MGGSAFKNGSFPRLLPTDYAALKQRHTLALKTLYSLVGTPVEAPEKTSHGDLDYIVCQMNSQLPSHDTVKDALGAAMVKPGPRTSSYAIPLIETDNFVQVDVHVCGTEDEYQRTMFFHSYGDMGMLLGLIVRNLGLHLGVHGLKYPQPPHPAWPLSSKFEEIIPFFGWDLSRHQHGFQTRSELFQWIASTPFIRRSMFSSPDGTFRRVSADRTLFWDFVKWQNEQKRPELPLTPLRDAALEHFGKKQEVETFWCKEAARARCKAAFNGKKVSEWASLGDDWKSVKLIMDEVRLQLGGDEAIVRLVGELGDQAEAKLKELVSACAVKVKCRIQSW